MPSMEWKMPHAANESPWVRVGTFLAKRVIGHPSQRLEVQETGMDGRDVL
jgi:hypothetical protein